MFLSVLKYITVDFMNNSLQYPGFDGRRGIFAEFREIANRNFGQGQGLGIFMQSFHS